MKIAVAAYPFDWFNRWNDYVGKLRVWVRNAAEQGADLMVFPEHGALELASLAGEENARDSRADGGGADRADQGRGRAARQPRARVQGAYLRRLGPAAAARRGDGQPGASLRPGREPRRAGQAGAEPLRARGLGHGAGRGGAGVRDLARADRHPHRLRRGVPAAGAGDGRGGGGDPAGAERHRLAARVCAGPDRGAGAGAGEPVRGGAGGDAGHGRLAGGGHAQHRRRGDLRAAGFWVFPRPG